jgi:hypothetical protein
VVVADCHNISGHQSTLDAHWTDAATSYLSAWRLSDVLSRSELPSAIAAVGIARTSVRGLISLIAVSDYSTDLIRLTDEGTKEIDADTPQLTSAIDLERSELAIMMADEISVGRLSVIPGWPLVAATRFKQREHILDLLRRYNHSDCGEQLRLSNQMIRDWRENVSSPLEHPVDVIVQAELSACDVHISSWALREAMALLREPLRSGTVPSEWPGDDAELTEHHLGYHASIADSSFSLIALDGLRKGQPIVHFTWR